MFATTFRIGSILCQFLLLLKGEDTFMVILKYFVVLDVGPELLYCCCYCIVFVLYV